MPDFHREIDFNMQAFWAAGTNITFASLGELCEKILDQHPFATHFTAGWSDQGDHLTLGEVERDGESIDDDFDDDALADNLDGRDEASWAPFATDTGDPTNCYRFEIAPALDAARQHFGG